MMITLELKMAGDKTTLTITEIIEENILVQIIRICRLFEYEFS
jgi:hypothetical protein